MTGRRGFAVGHLRGVQLGAEIREYMERIESTFEPFGGQWLVHGTQPEVVEGAWSWDVVIIAFPSIEAARRWYFSDAYQRILELRSEHAESHVVLLESVRDDYRAAETIAKLFDG
ncbi:MAG TPA: DUF1330 domain-containing protein [Candidatus Agrococcus pullicola]|uniref:DUF1330 domain-containing protein n=1 Tax=Candidatus Agrococcus pullicola TaxID=2838429 RepID=A0A9D2CAV5_9MICO|nr:DUF1330 domain-containing protein [Candidatus Agrococcus pullicola]